MVRALCRSVLLAACVLLVAAWIASGWWMTGVRVRCPDRYRALNVFCGGVRYEVYGRVTTWTPRALSEPRFRWTFTSIWGDAAPVYIWLPKRAGAVGAPTVFIPFWLPTILLAAPAAWLSLARRRARACPCGYDLRGLAASAPCPECGQSQEGRSPKIR